MCGEGGEYESLVLDAPLYKRKIVLDKVRVVTHSDSTICPVLYLVVEQFHLEDKSADYDPVKEILRLHAEVPLVGVWLGK